MIERQDYRLLQPARPRRRLGLRWVQDASRGAPALAPILVAYLSDFEAVDGAAGLIAQARRVERCDVAQRGIVARYIDSGRPDGPPRAGHALAALIKDAKAERVAVVVETISRLGPDRATALKGTLELLRAGAEIFEATGGRVIFEAEVAARIAECGR